jgi:hypothetical protein
VTKSQKEFQNNKLRPQPKVMAQKKQQYVLFKGNVQQKLNFHLDKF